MQTTKTLPGRLVPKGYQKISLAAATALTVPAGAKYALLRADVQNVWMRDDGIDPAVDGGIELKTTDELFLYTGDLSRVKFIQDVAGAILYVLYYGDGTV